MALFHQPPPPHIGGAQPHAPRQLAPALTAVAVNNPPFAQAQRWAAWLNIARLNDAPAPQPFIGARQPLAARKLPAALTAVAVDNPPFAGGARSLVRRYGLRQAWEPPWPLPARQRYRVQQATLSADEPPFAGSVRDQDVFYALWQSWAPAEPARALRPAVVQPGVLAENPPGLSLSSRHATVMAWQQDQWLLPRRWLPPSVTAVAVDDPPFSGGARALTALYALRQLWEPPQLLPHRQSYLAQPSALPADDPPRLSLLNLYCLLAAWDAPAPGQIIRRLSPGIPGQSADSPPPRLGAGQSLFFAPPAGEIFLPLRPRIAAIIGGAVAPANDPPWGLRGRVWQVIELWEPEAPGRILLPRLIVSGATAAAPDIIIFSNVALSAGPRLASPALAAGARFKNVRIV